MIQKKEKPSFESRNFGANKLCASSKEKNETEIAVASNSYKRIGKLNKTQRNILRDNLEEEAVYKIKRATAWSAGNAPAALKRQD